MPISSWVTDVYKDTPTNCSHCEKAFEENQFFQAEVRHMIAKHGINAGEELINRKYEEWHENGHEDGSTNADGIN